jgi:predicted transposase/invertase (TIGR01784 family)
MQLLDPKNDFVFKKLFAQAPALLAELINAVRSTAPPVQVIEVLNPTVTPEELTGKFIVLDVLAQDDTGRRYNIEMQARRDIDWSARSVYYLARTLTQQLDGGDDYTRLRAAIGIHLLDFDLYTDPLDQDQAAWCFELRDRLRSAVRLGEELELNLIELRKADRLAGERAPSGGSAALAAWVTFMEHWQEEALMAQIDYPPVKLALARVRELSADEETRRLALVRERAVRDERSALRTAREEGRIEGVLEGKLEGKLEGQAALLVRLLTRRFGRLSESAHARLSMADAQELARWADRLLDAASLEDVFSAE